MDAQTIRNKVVFTMLRNKVVGGHKKQVQTLVGWAVPTDARGEAERILDEMVADPSVPVEAYGGGHRDNVRLTNTAAAVEYLEANDGDVPFGYD